MRVRACMCVYVCAMVCVCVQVCVWYLLVLHFDVNKDVGLEANSSSSVIAVAIPSMYGARKCFVYVCTHSLVSMSVDFFACVWKIVARVDARAASAHVMFECCVAIYKG